MRRAREWCRLAGWLAWTMLALAAGAAHADTPITLFKSFAGNVNFVGTQKTMRTKANQNNSKNACAVAASTTPLTATLSGIPASATILSAHLYWAGSGSSPDYTITFEGGPVTAVGTRKYASATIGYNYFGGAADVTAQVAHKRNGSYTFSDLDIDANDPYCAVEGVLGGFSLLVIYADASEPFRLLNLYEGFAYIHYSGITLNLSNFKIPTPLGNTVTARVGHITWEGDATLGANGETLKFNGAEMTDNLNPTQNQFNSASNINGDAASYGIDFDAYTVISPAIAAGQTSASTLYQSGQDLVLLNAEIIAVPNVPVADLGITIQRTGGLSPQVNVSYALTVANYGPNTESGPITVTDVLPAGLGYVSAGGSGWGCGVSGKTVTCTYANALLPNASLPAITVAATVTGSGAITNTAGVGGQMFDNVAGNNTASDTGTVAAPPSYVLTDQACTAGLALADPAQPCKTFGSAATVAGTQVPVFVTAMVNGLVAVPAAATPSMTFALGCVNPASGAGVNATLAGAALPACAANGAAPATWSAAIAVSFSGSSPSAAALAFIYNDVGKVQLYLRDPAGNVVSSLAFVSAPDRLALSAIRQGSTSNPATLSPIGPVFVRAGTAFSMTASALTSAGQAAPNFGRETPPEKFALARPVPITDPATFPPQPFAELGNMPAFGGSDFAGVTISGGVATGNFTWDEVGIVKVTLATASGTYLGAAIAGTTPSTIGRFIPDHFDTPTTGTMTCSPAAMGCTAAVPWAAYAGQPFTVTVQARSASGTLIKNFNGAFSRTTTLSAYDAAGGTVANPPVTPSGSSLSVTTVPRSAFSDGHTSGVVGAIATPAYNLPNPYNSSAPHALNWTAPIMIYVRADAQEQNGAATVAITSNRGAASGEGPMRIVSGRLLVANVYGSDRLRAPVPIEAQYWSAAGRWETSGSDGQILPAASTLSLSQCTPTLAAFCGSALSVDTGPASMTLVNGRATLALKAPGAGNAGHADTRIHGSPAWLPSTVGRASFGVYKSKLIYIRELY